MSTPNPEPVCPARCPGHGLPCDFDVDSDFDDAVYHFAADRDTHELHGWTGDACTILEPAPIFGRPRIITVRLPEGSPL